MTLGAYLPKHPRNPFQGGRLLKSVVLDKEAGTRILSEGDEALTEGGYQ